MNVAMTKTELLTAEVSDLTDEQVDGLIAYARYLKSEPMYYSAPPEVLASIERGLADAEAERVSPGEKVLDGLRKKLGQSEGQS